MEQVRQGDYSSEIGYGYDSNYDAGYGSDCYSGHTQDFAGICNISNNLIFLRALAQLSLQNQRGETKEKL